MRISKRNRISAFCGWAEDWVGFRIYTNSSGFDDLAIETSPRLGDGCRYAMYSSTIPTHTLNWHMCKITLARCIFSSTLIYGSYCLARECLCGELRFLLFGAPWAFPSLAWILYVVES